MRIKKNLLLALAATLTIAPAGYSAPDSASFTYDTLGRLKQITYANGTIVLFNYDAVGNRTSVVVTCAPGGC